MHHLYIITGASRGLGLALARQLLGPAHRLLCLSRRTNEALADEARAAGASCEQWSQDLADARTAAQRLSAWLKGHDPKAVASATLINNAGVISRVGPLEDSEATDLAHALRVGLEAPLLLTSAFLRATQHWSVPRKVLNVSSGLGRRAMAGSAAYCAAKAGMDHFSRCVALEQARLPHGARIVSLAPGVIDTDMQEQLRHSDPAGFPDHERFVQLQAQGLLSTPEDAARRLLEYLERPDFGQHPVADVREA
ncbi:MULTISPECIES: SDR family NAD(P)-dependent oxidoreductase [Caldimonas]|jgi:benzil reductase ((S)-benzoin forming)|uniref:SDR family NAD(P)-dependent oxidoreductase n=1 Tax=Caldimonas TaxID=196013 RepID=UPI000379FE08|nr:SDR family NAD(P)-dependent oxidoreductase [Caldimonas manganoxidans]